ncbi:Protein of unknown function [Gryllus bimaculatus]|nr:Protein of unknown function [Gryllus bimaculatus]
MEEASVAAPERPQAFHLPFEVDGDGDGDSSGSRVPGECEENSGYSHLIFKSFMMKWCVIKNCTV